MSDEDNNEQPVVVPDEAQQAAISLIASLVKAFRPEVPDEAVLAIAGGEIAQQQGLGVVLSDAVDDAKRESKPIFGLHLRNLDTDEIVATLEAPKDLRQVKSLNELKHGIDVIALSTSPAARAVLRGFGFGIEFFQKKEKEPSRIVMPH